MHPEFLLRTLFSNWPRRLNLFLKTRVLETRGKKTLEFCTTPANQTRLTHARAIEDFFVLLRCQKNRRHALHYLEQSIPVSNWRKDISPTLLTPTQIFADHSALASKLFSVILVPN